MNELEKIEKIEKRKIVPVIAKISAGKSKLLNVLYNINFLECKAGIGTQFVNLLRYNPNIKEPCFYHLIASKEGENYIFCKDLNEFYEGEQNIIDANKKINAKLRNENEKNYDQIFYMTEINDSPFLKDKEYLLNHDLCDIPGLSEEQSTSTPKDEDGGTNQNSIKDKDSEKNKDKQENEMKTVEEDDIYEEAKDIQKNTYLSEIFGRIKNYVEEAIIIFNVENYQHKDNYQLIAKYHRVIGKEISHCLILLNKLDLSTNPEEDIDNCKSLIIKYFPKCQTFNLNLNTFIGLSLEQVQNELLLNESFTYFFYYLFDNYYLKLKEMSKSSSNKQSFITHLKELIKNYKKIEVNEIKSKVNVLNKSENISEINKEIISTIEYLQKKFEGQDINFGFTKNDFNDDKDNNDDDEDDENSEDEENKDNFDSIPISFIIKILYIYYKEKILIPPISKETKNLLNYFKTEKKLINLANNTNLVITNGKKATELEKIFVSLCDKLKRSKIDINKIQNLIDEITDTIKFVNLSDQIFIPFLGPSNAGKTTIINGIIGRNILPTDLKECTKRGILISYSDKEDDEISIYKSSFIEEKCFDKTYYYLDEGYRIGKGLNQVHDLLKGLNYEFTDKERDCFYYIKTKIKLFDELGLNDSIKRKIYLIDFPGYGTDNKFMEKEICKRIIGISSAFIFVLRNSIIKENKTKQIIENIFEQTKIEKKKIYSGIIKSCSFILNNDNSQTTNDIDIELAKKDIQEIIDLDKDTIDTNNINLCFFNGRYFCDYCNDYIYFFNLEETFENEYNIFLDSKKKIFQWPEYKNKKNNSFFDFLSTKLNERLKNKFIIDNKKIKAQAINDDAKKELDKIFDKYKELQYINIDEIHKRGDIIKKIFSYGQDKINDLNTLKESNIENLKNLLTYQFKYSYNNIKEDFGNKIDIILSTLDEFFPLDFSNYQPNLKEIENLKVKLSKIKEKLNELFNYNEKNINNLFSSHKKYIQTILNNKKQNMQNILKNEKSVNILREIDKEIEEKQNEINGQIKKILDNMTNSTVIIFEDGNKEISEFSGRKIQLKLLYKFDEYLSAEIGDNNKSNLIGQLSLEINSLNTLSKIYEDKGFISYIKSTFSDYHYIINNIDIILANILKKLDYISSLLKGNLTRYIQSLYHVINKAFDLASLRFTEEQLKIWKEIGDYYHSNKTQIYKAKNDILQININN